jgi:hypothetical protein
MRVVKRVRPIMFVGTVSAGLFLACGMLKGGQPATVDLIHRRPPDIASVGDDPFGKLVAFRAPGPSASVARRSCP